MNKPPIMSTRSDLAHIWESHQATRLVELPTLARLTGVGRVFAKAEWERPLGNFKALGGMVAGLRALTRVAGLGSVQELIAATGSISLPRLICASDGNHGLAVTAAANRVGGRACVYLPTSVGMPRAARILALGGDIVWVSGTYDDAVGLAVAAAARGDGLLIPDTTEDPDNEVVRDVMAGYAVMTDEIAQQIGDKPRDRPSHLFIQAGVGGLAAAMADGLHAVMQAPKQIVVVEPESAACVARALSEGAPVRIDGNLHTSAGMLSCGLASAPAVAVLQHHGAQCILVSEEQLNDAVATLHERADIRTTPSGSAGFAGFLHVATQAALRKRYQLDMRSNVLLVITEGPVADDVDPHSSTKPQGESGLLPANSRRSRTPVTFDISGGIRHPIR